ncbi:MAG: hypothetical protein J6386_23325 [Candidatus Synoicihabitans palmerolidicus]|nr:hypothetical protein [Candidatus Synoicihabitans palmerolidicus]
MGDTAGEGAECIEFLGLEEAMFGVAKLLAGTDLGSGVFDDEENPSQLADGGPADMDESPFSSSDFQVTSDWEQYSPGPSGQTAITRKNRERIRQG